MSGPSVGRRRLRRNITTEPTAPTKIAGGQIRIARRKAATPRPCSNTWSARILSTSPATPWKTLCRMPNITKPTTDAHRKSPNLFAVRQGWTKARIRAVAAPKAKRIPGGLSLIPTTTAAVAEAQQIARKTNVRVRLRGVDRASSISTSLSERGIRQSNACLPANEECQPESRSSPRVTSRCNHARA